jgi:sulfite exporter TauE/SafE
VTNWVAGRVDRYVEGPGIVGLGALHGLLPCPMLYPAYLYAFATGSAVSGFVVLGYVLVAHGLMAVDVHIPHSMLPHYQPLGGAMGH